MSVPETTSILASSSVDGDIIKASIGGDVDLNNSPTLRQALLALIKDKKPSKIIIDVSRVSYMDSSAIAVLVEVLKKVRDHQGKVCLIALQPRVKGLLEIARLDQIFIVAKDEAEARAR